jgi:hypothetical protein
MRQHPRSALAAMLLVLLAVSPALAVKPLVSPLLNNCPGTTDTFTCMVLNTGKGATLPDVNIELVRKDGSTIVKVGPFSLFPNDPRVVFWEASECSAYCRVTGHVSKNRTKITLCNGESAGGPCEAVVTGP